ncbi:MAG: YihY/virulence factor BrkB family protein [Bdellovibrionales bacterium]|nr:YihY/virulence factor BrkB family protein [Bdellovibrionales bacterium]
MNHSNSKTGFIGKLIHFLRDSELRLLASSMAFTTILSLVPLLTVSLYVFQKLGGFEESMAKLRPLVFTYFAEGVGQEAVNKLELLIHRLQGGSISVMGTVFLFLASLKLLNDMEKAVQKIWGIHELRPLWQRVTYHSLIITLGPLSAAILFGFLSWQQLIVMRFLPDRTMFLLLGWIMLFLLVRLLPKTQVSTRAAMISSLLTFIAIALVQFVYLKLTKTLFRYDRIYGSLATLPVFMMWIYINWTLYLFGHALCAALQRHWNGTLES